MNLRGSLVIAMILVVGSAGVSDTYAGDGWWWGNSKSSSSASSSSGKKGVSAWLPSWNSSASKASKPKKPSMFSSLGQNTKKAWGKTTSFLSSPFDKASRTSSDQGANSSSWWPKREPEPKPPTTVPDWLTQPRP